MIVEYYFVSILFKHHRLDFSILDGEWRRQLTAVSKPLGRYPLSHKSEIRPVFKFN